VAAADPAAERRQARARRHLARRRALRQRLVITADLPVNLANGEAYDEALVNAVKRFQLRHGLTPTGAVGPQTLSALNVPVATRLRALTASYERLLATPFGFGPRYVIVNLPAAVAEAVANGRVEHRYVAVVGKPDRPSPVVAANLSTINLNPTWTVPLSILKKDVVRKMAKDPTYLARMHMRLLDGAGGEIDPTLVDWQGGGAPAYTVRQDLGAWNSLGYLRIDMPNPHSVYMHDTPHRELFGSDYRFHSSGCARSATCARSPPGSWPTIRNGAARRSTPASPPARASTSASPARCRSPGSISPAGR